MTAECESTISIKLLMCSIMTFSSPAVPAPPVKFQLCRVWGKKKHAASSALNQNNYPEKRTAEPVRGAGNEALRLLAIASPQSLLVISLSLSLVLWKRRWMVWEEAT